MREDLEVSKHYQKDQGKINFINVIMYFYRPFVLTLLKRNEIKESS